MKTYMKYLGIVGLLTIEAVSVNKLSNFGLDTIFAIWGGLYFILLYRQFINFGRAPSIHHTAGGSISGVLHKSPRIMLKQGEYAELKEHSRILLKNLSIKIIYLTLFLGHIGICYYLIKFPS